MTSPLKNKRFPSLAQGKFRREQRPLDLRDKYFPSQEYSIPNSQS